MAKISNIYIPSDPDLRHKRYVWKPRLPHIVVGMTIWLTSMFLIGMAWGGW